MSVSSDSPLTFGCPVPLANNDRILLSHGGGGRMSRRLIHDLFHKHFRSSELARDETQAVEGPRQRRPDNEPPSPRAAGRRTAEPEEGPLLRPPPGPGTAPGLNGHNNEPRPQ